MTPEPAIEDAELLRRYAVDKSEAAFTELVRRRVDLVYSVALRQVGGDAHLAEDVTQRVFADLARKAGSLLDRPVLSGWLYRSAQYAASDMVRSERRRRAREERSQRLEELAPGPVEEWERVRPLLAEAMDELSEADRDAVALRFFEGRAFADIGRALRLTEEAARKRVERALDRMCASLARRGITSTSAALGLALANQVGAAAPAGLAAAVGGAALGAGAVAGWGVLAFLGSAKGVALAVAGVAVAGGLVYQTLAARPQAVELAAGRTEQARLQTQVAALERRAQAAERRAQAAEADALELLEAIGRLRPGGGRGVVTGAVESEADAGPVTREMVEARYKRGQALARAGQWAEALREFLWCFDEGMLRVSSYTGVRVSFLLGDVERLAQRYPPALDALRERRDRAERTVLATPNAREAAGDLAALNRTLGQNARTVDLLDRLPRGDARRAAFAIPDVIKLLAESRRYAEVVELQPYERMASLFDTLAQPRIGKNEPESARQSRRRYAVASAAVHVEALAGAGQLDRARDLARKVLGVDDSAETRSVLQQHLARAGQPRLLAEL